MWSPFDPQQAKAFFDPTGLEWWVAGGWAIEAFTGVARHHEDIDVSLWRRDVGALVRHLAGRYDVWAAGDGALKPLVGDDAGDARQRRPGLAPRARAGDRGEPTAC